MKFNQLYNKLFCVMQWGIGFSENNIEQIIREKKDTLPGINWLPLRNNSQSIADPFIFKDADGNINLLYEDFSMIKPRTYGKIRLSTLDKKFNIINTKELLDTKSHCSYPFVFFENGITYVIPETALQNNVSVFEYDYVNKCLINKKVLIKNLPLLDSTIFKYKGMYWLFATLGENGYDNSQLNIYFSDNFFGEYKPHRSNPVKNNQDGLRPAGNIIEVDGEIYRPSQNCSSYYGESITINKITRLSEYEFSEESYFQIKPDRQSEYNAGIHTINFIDGLIVVDGIKMVFKPLVKWKLFFIKKLKINIQ